MPQYRKKPVVIEARQFHPLTGHTLTNGRILADWCGGHYGEDALGPRIVIDTLEGQMRAEPGDFIICGVNGEFYPCKPDIFAKTYEAV